MRTTLVALIGLGLVGCIGTIGDTTSNIEGEGGGGLGDFDRDDCKIEGGAIGREGHVLPLGDRSVELYDWVAKAGSPGEYVGFSIRLTGTNNIGYVVKSGGETAHSTELTWLHAAGPNGGSNAPGISNVDFCEVCEDGSCGGGDGGGDGGGGDGGDDGCIEGCDDDDGGDGGDNGDGDDGSDGCIEGCDEDGGGDGGLGADGDGPFGDGNCFEPGGCDGGSSGGDVPPSVNPGDDDSDGVVLL